MLSVEVQSDKRLIVSLSSNVSYLLIGKSKEDSKQSLLESYIMSPSVDKRRIGFVLTVLGNHTRAADSTTLTATFSVSAPGAEDQDVTVQTQLEPYPSCRHTQVEGIEATVVHTSTEMRLRMVAKDTDGFLVTKTNCKFSIELVYESTVAATNVTLAVVRNSSSPSEYYANILPDHILREGLYLVNVHMHQAWNDAEDRKSTV